MFIVELTYIANLNEVDKHLEAHINYLNKQYELNNFIASGRKEPRDGGIILSKMANKSSLLKVLNQDPFKLLKIADYKITEFIPSKTNLNFQNLLE